MRKWRQWDEIVCQDSYYMSRHRWHASPGCQIAGSLRSLGGCAMIANKWFLVGLPTRVCFWWAPAIYVCMNKIEKQHLGVIHMTLAYCKEENTTENKSHWYIPMHKLFLFIFWDQMCFFRYTHICILLKHRAIYLLNVYSMTCTFFLAQKVISWYLF